MRQEHQGLGLKQVCELFGITRQAYYEYIKRSTRVDLDGEQVVNMVRSIRKTHPKMGCRKLYTLMKTDLEKQGIKIVRDRLFDLLSDNQLLIRKRKNRTVTTNSYHHFKRHTNKIKEFEPYKSNQLWVSDITYIKYEEEFYYLFLITDAYSKKIVGYKLATSLEAKHAVECLKQAIEEEQGVEGIIHHSDRGIQYCSHKYVKVLQDYGIEISMTEDGNPLDNSIAERVNGILKSEYIDELKNHAGLDIFEAVKSSIYRYNQLRPHLSCDMMTPNQAHKVIGPLKKHWKNYYKLKQESY